jgi:carbon starvation protein CstA
LVVSIPLFAIGIAIAFMEFDVIWRYFAWSNQALSVITLWMITSWLMRRGSKWSFIALIPAICMTYVCASFFFVSGQFVGMCATMLAYIYGGALTAVIAGLMMRLIRKNIDDEGNI